MLVVFCYISLLYSSVSRGRACICVVSSFKDEEEEEEEVEVIPLGGHISSGILTLEQKIGLEKILLRRSLSVKDNFFICRSAPFNDHP